MDYTQHWTKQNTPISKQANKVSKSIYICLQEAHLKTEHMDKDMQVKGLNKRS